MFDVNSSRSTFRRLLVITFMLGTVFVIACSGGAAPANVVQSQSDCEWCGAMDAPANVSWRTVIAPETEPGQRLIVSGTVYQEDGKTPAPGVLIYAYHTNAAGIYPKRTADTGRPQWRHGYLRGWMRTGADGKYEFETIKAAAYPTRDEPAHIHLTISANGYTEYSSTFWFADDPLITDAVRARNAAPPRTRTSHPSVILDLTKDPNGVLHATHDFKLERF